MSKTFAHIWTTSSAGLQPIQIGLGNSQTTQDLWKVNYDYGTTDNNGNVKSQQITVPSQFTAIQNYSYDSLNRLKSATETISGSQTWKQTFTFDRYGNRKFDVSQTTTLGNCPVAVCNPDISVNNNRVVGHSFDNSGNTTIDGEGKTFFYDAENKQKEVRNAQNQIIGQYLYDADGKRVKKIAANDTTIFVYDAGGKLASEYLITASQSQAPQTSYLTNDTLGSPRVTTDSSGNVVSRRDFMPFGEEIPRASYGSDSVRQKYTGYERDNETDLDFAQARMYNKNHGRFNSVDPIMMEKRRLADPQAINLFAYVRNNPLKYVDPDGETFKGTDDKEVIIKQEKVNGKKIWVIKSNNASTDLQKLVGLINNSGSKTASSQLNKLNTQATMINLVIDTKTTGGTRLGLHEAHDKNGPVNFNSKAEKFDRPADPAVDDKGKVIEGAYREATITLFEGEYRARQGSTDETVAEGLVSTFGHEAQHDLDPKQVRAGTTGTGSDATWHPEKNGKPAKQSPNWYGDKISKEIKEHRRKSP